MPTLTQQLKDRVRAATLAAFAQAAGQVVEGVRAELATPYPPSSQPGMPPHLRTGSLQDGIQANVESSPSDVVMTVSSSRVDGDPAVPIYLEFGTRNMQPRPYMTPAKELWGQRIQSAHANALRHL